MLEETIDERGGNDWIAEDLTPFGEFAIGREDHGATLVANVDELEEQVAAARNHHPWCAVYNLPGDPGIAAGAALRLA